MQINEELLKKNQKLSPLVIIFDDASNIIEPFLYMFKKDKNKQISNIKCLIFIELKNKSNGDYFFTKNNSILDQEDIHFLNLEDDFSDGLSWFENLNSSKDSNE